MKREILYIIAILISIYSCKKHGDNNDKTLSEGNYLDTLNSTLNIQTRGAAIIDSAINAVANTSNTFDIQSIIDKVKKIDGVKDASATSGNTSINVEKADGSSCSLFVFTKGDNRLIQPTTIKTIPTAINQHINDITPPNPIGSSNVYPSNRKALIIAPFEHDLLEGTETVHSMLYDAGYTTTVLYDTECTRDKFTGDYLAQFGVIYITTHGNSKIKLKGNLVTALLSGEKVTAENKKTLTPLERAYLTPNSIPTDNTTSYFNITVPYLTHTLTKKFPNSWVFVMACESADRSDLENFFLSNGAACFSAFHGDIESSYGDCVGIELTSLLTSGYDFHQACYNVKYNQGIYETLIEKLTKGFITMNSFYYNMSTSSLFNLIGSYPGYAVASPNYGRAGDRVNLTVNLDYTTTIKTKTIGYTFTAKPINAPQDTLYHPILPKNPAAYSFFGFTGNNIIMPYPTFKYPYPLLFHFTVEDKNGNFPIRMTVPYTIHNY